MVAALLFKIYYLITKIISRKTYFLSCIDATYQPLENYKIQNWSALDEKAEVLLLAHLWADRIKILRISEEPSICGCITDNLLEIGVAAPLILVHFVTIPPIT
jgi:hypothetical protein